MGAGGLRNYVQIKEYAAAKNNYGEEVKTWSVFASTWAEIKPIKAEEYFSAMSERHKVTHRVIVRYISGVKPNMIIEFGGRTFEIIGIRDYYERTKYLELMCKEQ